MRDGRKVVAKEGDVIDSKALATKIVSLLKKENMTEIQVRAYVVMKELYVDADRERHLTIAQANTALNAKNEYIETRVHARKFGEPVLAHVRDVTHTDVSPKQILSVSTSLIPFLEHDDNTRASMGTNMQRQAVPLIRGHSPLVGTGMESVAARASGHVLLAQDDGEVTVRRRSRDRRRCTTPARRRPTCWTPSCAPTRVRVSTCVRVWRAA